MYNEHIPSHMEENARASNKSGCFPISRGNVLIISVCLVHELCIRKRCASVCTKHNDSSTILWFLEEKVFVATRPTLLFMVNRISNLFFYSDGHSRMCVLEGTHNLLYVRRQKQANISFPDHSVSELKSSHSRMWIRPMELRKLPIPTSLMMIFLCLFNYSADSSAAQ